MSNCYECYSQTYTDSVYDTDGDFVSPSVIPAPQYMGMMGEACDSNIQCHNPLYCIDNKCREEVPLTLLQSQPQSLKSPVPSSSIPVQNIAYLQISANKKYISGINTYNTLSRN
jgi:hypothetical protein